jgi:hypothetical protein
VSGDIAEGTTLTPLLTAGGHQPSIAPTVVRAWHNVWARCLSLFSQQLSAAAEQTPALLLLPSPVVAAILAVQLRIMYAVWLSVNINTSLAYVSLWAAMSFLAPHLLLYYMRRLVEADKAGHKPKEELPTQQLQGRLHKPGKDSGITQEGQSSEDITEASKVVASGSAGGSSAPTAVRSHISAHPPPPPLAPASLTQPSQLPSRPATLQSLRNALRLLQQASSGSRRYTSRLAPLQVGGCPSQVLASQLGIGPFQVEHQCKAGGAGRGRAGCRSWCSKAHAAPEVA